MIPSPKSEREVHVKTWQPMRIDVIGEVTQVVMGGYKHSGTKGGPGGGHGGGWSWFSWFW